MFQGHCWKERSVSFPIPTPEGRVHYSCGNWEKWEPLEKTRKRRRYAIQKHNKNLVRPQLFGLWSFNPTVKEHKKADKILI